MKLCYSESGFCKGRFCKNVYISAKWVTYNKVAFLFCPDGVRPRVCEGHDAPALTRQASVTFTDW